MRRAEGISINCEVFRYVVKNIGIMPLGYLGWDEVT